jgi:hypothetical protein
LTPAALNQLATVLRRMEANEARGEGFTRAMAGDRARALAALAEPQQLRRGLSAPDSKMPADRRAQISARLAEGKPLTAERDFFEVAFRRLLAARREPFPARLQADDLGRQLVAEALDRHLVVLDLVLPSLGRRTVTEAECLARLRLGWTAVALEQFCAAHDERYPAALSELLPDYLSAPLTDPFDGRLLRYRKKGSGYALYSIGRDLKDDAGRRLDGKDGDLVFEVVARTFIRHSSSR